MISVLIADDQPLIRQAVADLLDQDPDITIVGQAADGREALMKADSARPDVIVMDLRMPVLDGIAATQMLSASPRLAATKVLVLTTFEDDENVFAALRAGASGFIGKGAQPEEIARAVHAVHGGEALLSPVATRGLIEKYLRVSADERQLTPTPGLETLTEREFEVLVQVARGRSNAQIAQQIFVSPHTVKTHVYRVMSKLQVHDRAQLVIIAYESGLLRPGDERVRDFGESS